MKSKSLQSLSVQQKQAQLQQNSAPYWQSGPPPYSSTLSIKPQQGQPITTQPQGQPQQGQIPYPQQGQPSTTQPQQGQPPKSGLLKTLFQWSS